MSIIASVSQAGFNPGFIPPRPAPAPQPDQTAIDAAQKALAVANSTVDTDKRNHSPACVASDQKLVDKAQIALAAAKLQTGPGSVLDLSL